MGITSLFRRRSTQPTLGDLPPMMAALAMVLFPNGRADIEAGGAHVRRLAHNKLSLEESMHLFAAVKALTVLPGDHSADRFRSSVEMRGMGRLAGDEIDEIMRFICGECEDTDGGGEGSEASPIVIRATNTGVGIAAEYKHLERLFGTRDRDWTVEARWHGPRGERYVEAFRLRMLDGSAREVYFDITSFFGKW